MLAQRPCFQVQDTIFERGDPGGQVAVGNFERVQSCTRACGIAVKCPKAFRLHVAHGFRELIDGFGFSLTVRNHFAMLHDCAESRFCSTSFAS
jgi:hypothetical protein